jgi:hypothetical protein
MRARAHTRNNPWYWNEIEIENKNKIMKVLPADGGLQYGAEAVHDGPRVLRHLL